MKRKTLVLSLRLAATVDIFLGGQSAFSCPPVSRHWLLLKIPTTTVRCLVLAMPCLKLVCCLVIAASRGLISEAATVGTEFTVNGTTNQNSFLPFQHKGTRTFLFFSPILSPLVEYLRSCLFCGLAGASICLIRRTRDCRSALKDKVTVCTSEYKQLLRLALFC